MELGIRRERGEEEEFLEGKVVGTIQDVLDQ